MPGSKMHDTDIRRVRALAMLQRRMVNIARRDIATEFNVKEDTVDTEISWAKKQGLVANYENQILNELVPAAIKTVKAAVAAGDVKAALEILKGSGVLHTKPAPPGGPPDGGAESLEIYVRKIAPQGEANNGRFQPRVTSNALPPLGEASLDAAGSAPAPDPGRAVEVGPIDAEVVASEDGAPGDEGHAADSE
jgi:hypothetical protein